MFVETTKTRGEKKRFTNEKHRQWLPDDIEDLISGEKIRIKKSNHHHFQTERENVQLEKKRSTFPCW